MSIQTGCRWAALTSALAGLLAATQLFAQPGNPAQWQSPLYPDHPLVGRVYSVAEDRFIDSEQLVEQLLTADVVMLGEKHDNADHHYLQLMMMQELARNGRFGGATFEMLDSSQQESVTQLNANPELGRDSLKEFLNWDEDGWNWDYYGPLVELALNAQVPISTGNISRSQMSEVYAAQASEFPPSPLSAAAMEQLNRDIDDSHCGMLPESQFPAMLRVQQARDRAMAEGISGQTGEGNRVLIAGNYHVRRDLGVLNYLPAELADATVSLSFLEVNPLSEIASDYVERTEGEAAYDFIWFTPALSDKDYCDSMRQ